MHFSHTSTKYWFYGFVLENKHCQPRAVSLAIRQFSTCCDDGNTKYYNNLCLFELLICHLREYVYLKSSIEIKLMAVMKTIVLSKQYHGDHSTHYSTSCILERKQMVTASRPKEIWWRDNMSDHSEIHGQWTRNSLVEEPFLLGISNMHLAYSPNHSISTQNQNAPPLLFEQNCFILFIAFFYQIIVYVCYCSPHVNI